MQSVPCTSVGLPLTVNLEAHSGTLSPSAIRLAPLLMIKVERRQLYYGNALDWTPP